MKTICCECNKIMKQGSEDPPSHGICLKCLPGSLKRAGLNDEEIKQTLKELEALK